MIKKTELSLQVLAKHDRLLDVRPHFGQPGLRAGGRTGRIAEQFVRAALDEIVC
jgi:predicted AAA+ superfamily ATPase